MLLLVSGHTFAVLEAADVAGLPVAPKRAVLAEPKCPPIGRVTSVSRVYGPQWAVGLEVDSRGCCVGGTVELELVFELKNNSYTRTQVEAWSVNPPAEGVGFSVSVYGQSTSANLTSARVVAAACR